MINPGQDASLRLSNKLLVARHGSNAGHRLIEATHHLPLIALLIPQQQRDDERRKPEDRAEEVEARLAVSLGLGDERGDEGEGRDGDEYEQDGEGASHAGQESPGELVDADADHKGGEAERLFLVLQLGGCGATHDHTSYLVQTGNTSAASYIIC